MSLYYSAAGSSRISKAKAKKPPLRRSSSSPFSGHPRQKSLGRSSSKADVSREDDLLEDRLEDLGLVATLAHDLSLRDVAQVIPYVRRRMFTSLPEQASGMSSTRIAEVLNFRRSLPPIVTVAHLHAVLNSPTTTERETAELVRAGLVRRIVVPGRGVGGSSVGEGLVLMEDWTRMVSEGEELDDQIRANFLDILRRRPAVMSLPSSLFSVEEARQLMRGGFLTASNASWSSSDILSCPGMGSRGTLMSLSRVASRSASGSMAAVGGEGAVHDVGGGGGGGGGGSHGRRDGESHGRRGGESHGRHDSPGRRDGTDSPLFKGGAFQLSLPTTGPYLRLLTSARAHLLSLLSRSKYREAPLDLLRERWDGGIAGDDASSRSRKARGEFTGVLPGRTRKWKQFYGLSFEWVLGECVGAGLVELFETGSVGKAARAT